MSEIKLNLSVTTVSDNRHLPITNIVYVSALLQLITGFPEATNGYGWSFVAKRS